MLESFRSDVTFAARMLRKYPLFSLVAVSCIAIGSGAVATIYSAMNAMVLRPLSGTTDAARLFRIERKKLGSPDGASASYPYYLYLRDHTRTLDGLAAWGKARLSLRSEGQDMGASVYANFVSGNYFSVLGVRAALGRLLRPDEDRDPGAHPVIVVSAAFWRDHLGGDRRAIDKPIWVNGRRFTLVGVTSAEFPGTEAPIVTDAWVPLAMRPALFPSYQPLTSWSSAWLRLAGRLQHGVSPGAASRELSVLTSAVASAYPEPTWMGKYGDLRFSQLIGLSPDASGPLAQFLAILLAAAGLVLIVASVNVASMLSARGVARRLEMSVRTALGAARGRLVRQLLTEIVLLFMVGAGGGIAVAYAATAALERIRIPSEVQFSLDLTPDPRVFAFALGTSMLVGLAVGLAPALRAARSDVATRLRDGVAGASARRPFMASALVAGQLALSLVLLVGAGLFVRALQRASHVNPGFDATGVSTVTLDADSWGYDSTRARTFFNTLRDRVREVPGVTDVSYTTMLPLGLRTSADNIQVAGSADHVQVQLNQVDAGYFSTLRIPLVAGRAIERGDDQRSSNVAVVNETFAKRFWPTGNAVGRTFEYANAPVTIVGVARDAKYASLAEQTPALAYVPMAQQWRAQQVLLARSSGDPTVLARGIQEAIRSIDAELPRPAVLTLGEAMSLGTLPQRVAALVTGVLGATGLLLAVIGLYGVIAYSVSRRTREIGIRLALGARRADVLRMIVREGSRVVAAGIVVGLVLALGASRLIGSLLFGVRPLDPVAFGGMAIILAAFALFATWLPARRAASANPAQVLRGE